MIKKYIRGNKERGAEVIKALEELGGKNKSNFDGEDCNCLYYIREDSKIDLLGNSSDFGKVVQEYFEEIKLPEQPKFNVVIKEPKQIYWFIATEDDTKNQALFDKLCDLVGINKRGTRVSDGIVYFNPLKNSIKFRAYQNLDLECTIAMMVGKELVIDSSEDNTKYIDLGLPSGTLWAVWNVGANRPEEYGDYFEFGKWDSSLQVPTKEEFEELKKECKWEWASVNGENGYVVTGPNGKSIFLPAAGYSNGVSLYCRAYGYYWSSTPYESDDINAYTIQINSSNRTIYRYDRSICFCVRCVKRKQ